MFLSSLFAQCPVMTEHYWIGIFLTLTYFVLALLLLFVGWKVIDWITPGDLPAQLLGTADPETKRPAQPPNKALAIVVGFMFLGMCIIIAAAIK